MTAMPDGHAAVNGQRHYRCGTCGRGEYRRDVPATQGGSDAAAGAAGWRGQTCPACTGVASGYWDAMTLHAAKVAGVDAGRQP